MHASCDLRPAERPRPHAELVERPIQVLAGVAIATAAVEPSNLNTSER